MSFVDHRCNVCRHWRYQRHTSVSWGKRCYGGTQNVGTRPCRCTVCDYDTEPGVVHTYRLGAAVPSPVVAPGTTVNGYRTCDCPACTALAVDL